MRDACWTCLRRFWTFHRNLKTSEHVQAGPRVADPFARLGAMDLDWSSDGVDWRDESRDPDMARDWLREADGADHPGSDLWNRVYELTHEALDPPRGWRLVKLLVEHAQNDRQLWHIGG